jgi:hypothetical protein
MFWKMISMNAWYNAGFFLPGLERAGLVGAKNAKQRWAAVATGKKSAPKLAVPKANLS